MKLSKEELKKKVAEIVGDDETAVSLLEDIEDSMDVAEVTEEADTTAYDDLKAKYDELLAKYKERFISGAVEEDIEKDEEKTEEDNIEELEEEEVIDVQEI